MIDHRASPGLPPDFYAKLGLPGIVAGEGTVAEMPTLTCVHCNAVVILNPERTRARGHCFKCDAYVCDNPACHANCTPFAGKLDAAETAAYRVGQNLLLKGL